MARLFFTTVGTSCLHRVPDDVKEKSSDMVKRWTVEYLQTLYRRDLASVLPYSAEIKSLLKSDLTARDVVQLICTDTSAGVLCGEILREFFESEMGCEAQLHVVEGLQVTDSRLFRSKGIKNFLDLLVKVHEKYQYSHDMIINLTGGFKSVIPYSTVASMLLSIPFFYVFEFSDEIIDLPVLPISYDFSMFEKYQTKFEALDKEGALESSVFYHKVAYEDRAKLNLLVEQERKLVTLTPIGMLAWNKFASGLEVRLKPSDLAPEEKPIVLSNHHGKNRLTRLAKKLVRCPFVEGIECSDEFKPCSRRFIESTLDHYRVRVIDINSDAGYSMIIKPLRAIEMN